MARETSPFSKGSLDNALGVRDATKEISNFLKAIGADTSNFSRDFATVSREANNFATYQANAAKSTKNVNQLIEKANNLRGIANKQEAEASRIATQRNRIQKQIADTEKLIAKRSQEGKKLQKEALIQRVKGLKSETQELDKQAEAIVNQADNTKTLAGQFESLGRTSQDLSRNVYGTAAAISDTLGLSNHLTTSFQDANEIQRQKQIIQEDELELQGKINAALADYNNDKATSVKLTEEEFLANKNNALLGEKADKRFRDFGLEGVTQGAQGRTAGSNITGTKKGMQNTKSALPSELATMMKGLGKAIGALAKSLIVLQAIGKVIEMVEYAMFGVEKEAVELSRAFTMSKEEGFALRDSIRASAEASGLLGASHEHLLKMQLAFTESTGMSTRLNTDQLKTMSLMTRQLGMSTDQAVHLTELFKAQGVTSEEGLESLKESYDTMKLQGKATMTFKTLMSDITKDTELQHIAMSAGADAAMRQAQANRRIGLSLSQQRSLAEGTLDFEKTMTNQLELRMLTGKDINLQRAQELALQGKNGEAVSEIQRQMGKLTAEQRKNPIIMNKMLELAGMSREEFYEMENIQRQQNAAREKEQKILKILKEETKLFTALKATQFKNEQDYYAQLDKDTAKIAKNELEAYQNSKQYQLDLMSDQVAGLTEREKKEFLLNQQIQKFSDKQIHDAKVRSGLVGGELSSYEGLLTANETFAIAMEEVKVLFADLVGSGAIQFFTESLTDFAIRAKQVGIFGALRGKGLTEEELALENKNRQSTVNTSVESFKSGKMSDRKLVNSLLRSGDIDEAAIVKLSAEVGEERFKELLQMADRRFIGRQMSTSGSDEFNPLAYMNKPEEVKDFILRPGQPPIKFDKGDLLMGGTQLGMGGGKVEQLLEQLLAETKAGKVIKMDTATVARSLQLNATKMSY